MIANEIDHPPTWMGPSVNPLQRVIADAMAAKGHPIDTHGSKAWLAREADIWPTIITYIFNRENYLPESEHRAKLARALGIPKADLDDAGAAIRGLRGYATGSDVMRHLDEARAVIVLGEGELTPAELRKAQKKLDRLADEIAERLRGGKRDV